MSRGTRSGISFHATAGSMAGDVAPVLAGRGQGCRCRGTPDPPRREVSRSWRRRDDGLAARASRVGRGTARASAHRRRGAALDPWAIQPLAAHAGAQRRGGGVHSAVVRARAAPVPTAPVRRSVVLAERRERRTSREAWLRQGMIGAATSIIARRTDRPHPRLRSSSLEGTGAPRLRRRGGQDRRLVRSPRLIDDARVGSVTDPALPTPAETAASRLNPATPGGFSRDRRRDGAARSPARRRPPTRPAARPGKPLSPSTAGADRPRIAAGRAAKALSTDAAAARRERPAGRGGRLLCCSGPRRRAHRRPIW